MKIAGGLAALLALLFGLHARATRLIEARAPLLNQQDTTTCWAHAWTTYISLKASQTLGRPFAFSVEYLLYHDLRSRIWSAHNGDRHRVSQAGSIARAQALTREYGLLPIEAWAPPKNFFKRYKKTIDQSEDLLILNLSEDEFLARVERITSTHFPVPPPQEFRFSGKRLSPRDFADRILDQQELRSLALRADSPSWVTSHGSDLHQILGADGCGLPVTYARDEFIGSDFGSADRLVRAKIDHGEPLIFLFFSRNGQGHRTFDVVDTEGEMPIYTARFFNDDTYSGGHGLVIIGYDDQHWIAQNSHGPEGHPQGWRRLHLELVREHGNRLEGLYPCEKWLGD